jgi:hypothetical protein
LPFSHKINSYTMANLCIGNILLAFNSAIEEASNFVNATGEGSDKVREPSGTNASSLCSNWKLPIKVDRDADF